MLEFKCNFQPLLDNLSAVASVVEDSLTDDKVKNIIFKFNRYDDGRSNTAQLIGINQSIVYRRSIEDGVYSVGLEEDDCTAISHEDGSVEKVCYLQIKSKDLMNFLGTYKSVRTTTVEEVTFSINERGKIKCSVLELDKDTQKPLISNRVFDNYPISASISKGINFKSVTEGLVSIPCVNLLVHTKNLLPLMSNVSSLYGYLTFGEEHAVVFGSTCVTLMNNMLLEGDVFKNIKLSYRIVTFIDKVICSDPNNTVECALTDAGQLYFKTDNSEASVIYDTKLPEYQLYIDAFSREHAFSLDRKYLKDVLKRFSLSDETIEVTINAAESELRLSNSVFSQSISLKQVKNLDEFSNVSFKILPDVVNRAIIGSDDEFNFDTFMYFCPKDGKNVMLIFADESGTWYSVVSVKTFTKVAL